MCHPLPPPPLSLSLSYVYGYQCYSSRQNLYYLSSSELLYPCGSLAVVLSTATNSQKFVGGGLLANAVGHSDDIIALAVTKDRGKIATGEVGSNPLICVWNSLDLTRPIWEFPQGKGSRGVAILSFSITNTLLAAVDMSQDQFIRIFNLKQGAQVFMEKGYPGHVYSLAFGADEKFCSAGISHLFFWRKEEEGFVRDRAVYGMEGNECTMSTVQWLSTNEWITGGHDGKLYLWGISRLRKTQQVLPVSQEIHALAVSAQFIVTGGQDSTLHILDYALRKVRRVEVSDWPKAIDVWGEKLVCSTRDGIIVEIIKETQTIVMETHSEGEMWSIAQDPQHPNLLFSTGDDNKLKVWDTATRKCIATWPIEISTLHNTAHRSSLLPSSQQSRAIAVSSQGHVAVGHNDGHVSILHTSDLEITLFTLFDSSTWIRFLQYSPSGKLLASGNFIGQLTLYSVIHEYEVMHCIDTFQSQIVSIDWSNDEERVRVVSMDGEVKTFRVETGENYQDANNVEWATWTSPIGEALSGLVSLHSPNITTAVSRSHSQEFVAVGTAWGLLDIYTFPILPGSQPKSYKSHSLEVATAFWTLDDSFIFTAGGHDLSLMQWRVDSVPQ